MPAKTHEASDAVSPDSGDIKITKKGVALNWRVCAIIGLLGLGGGGFTVAARSFFGLDGANSLATPPPIKTIADELADNRVAHGAFTSKLDEHDKAIHGVSEKLTSVQTVQHRQVARDEARRVTEPIKNRTERERTYDRLLDLNLKRLADGRDTCQTADCGL